MAFVQIGEIVDKLVKLKLLIPVCIVLFEHLVNPRPIRHIRVPQIKRVLDLRAVDFVLIATASCLQQQGYLLVGWSHGTCRPMSGIAIHFDTICQLLGIQVARLVIVMILDQRPEFPKTCLLFLKRKSVFKVIIWQARSLNFNTPRPSKNRAAPGTLLLAHCHNSQLFAFCACEL